MRKNKLRKAISKLEKKGIVLQSQLKSGLEKLYDFTNDKDKGIRHGLIEEGYSPTCAEAIFMLVSCSAFINYITAKSIIIT